ncbi:hypothetical protein Dsin_026007 [Dipteronia sinensis]|uniref:F-box domain-containing protein n=1 Tax=Dipteronia sinensis TaxID=43782 RepID=A0AAD9ZXE4_9ROSI|nr:hypothetical protein Dsin_026007 [Dipteronia sinensis]
MAETITDSMDRISELPTFIIHHIMSYLSEKEAARTSILSKKWHCVHASFPILDFHEYYAYFVGKDLASRSMAEYQSRLGKKFQRHLIKFVKFVDASLLRFCKLGFSLQRFGLLACLLEAEQSSFFLDKWIGLVIKNGVKELDLDVPPGHVEWMYTLPEIVFLAKSLTILKLGGCKLEHPSGTIRFHSLESLTLRDVHINEDMLQKLTIGCPLLQDLFLFDCWGFRRIDVYKACKLKIIEIEEHSHDTIQSVKIDLPSLQGFRLRLKRPKLCTIDLVGCPNLNDLSLVCVNLMDQEFHCLISNFPFLENLSLSYCLLLNRVSISNYQLKILRVSDCRNLKAIDVDSPNLVLFRYSNDSIPTISMNALSTWKVCLEKINADAHTLWFLKIKEFLGFANQIKDLELYVEWDEDSVGLNEFKNGLTSLPCEVGNLCLHLTRGSFSSRLAWLDGFFRLYYSRNFVVAVMNEADIKFIELLHEEARNKDNIRCCNSHPIKCWRHYLKDFKIVKIVSLLTSKGYTNPSINIYDLMGELPFKITLHLDWCFSKSLDKV